MTSAIEQVLVVPRRLVIDRPGWRGLRRVPIRPLLDAIRAEGSYRPRPDMESDPSFKQIIPYLVLRDGPRWFLMRRTRAGSDARLHERFSIGVGGHVNAGDGGLKGGLLREWNEELDAPFVPAFRFVGLLNDDESDVGAVHLGVVYEAEAAGRPVAIRETDKLTGKFADEVEVRAACDRMETWSALVFDALAR